MKKLSLALILAIAFQFTGCKQKEKKQNTTTNPTTTKAIKKAFSVSNAKNTINFTAYKTTEKIPVKGVFTKVEFIKNYEANTLKEAINGAEFKIPVSGIETKDASRNFKIQKFFFNVMENTLSMTGKLILNDDKNGVAEFTMNGVTEKLPFEYTINDKTFSMKTTMNIEKWNAQKAIESLNTACKDLHKGKDGVSKTWNDVAIEVTSTFK